MLDNGTKRRIDTARDILVGKIPDPKSQVEQITIALIYKFMDDMDAESEELGGSRNFFADEFARYGWAKLMRSGLGGHEALNLYAEAIARMSENPGIPLLFRNIFKNAYLPYRDPETLRAFLKIIDEFNYDHSERLGDAFEYLLSVLGSQGDAGQFRTPRQIIDFIVEILAPQKNETVIDPACGTAGFLISSYKHILKNNLDEKGYSTLTPDEKGRMVENFKGYDISPDMVRLSLVNMYLHGFSDPHIYEYDTLTSQERWSEYADVILANPPFMSPKGGIRPHNRFSVQSKRSEVLFVDYIADHLTPEGRAGVIVPEGIIFQSQNAYKQLRKKLLEESLVAVISLPAGVFQPYSGVKTSILILDKALAKKADTIGFYKVENDGFGLGAQRRPIEKNDLPQVLEEVRGYLDSIKAGDCPDEYTPAMRLIVKREKVAENGEYNLSGERYRESIQSNSTWPIVSVGEIFVRVDQTVQPNEINGPISYIGLENIRREKGDIVGDIEPRVVENLKSLKSIFMPDDILYGKLRPNLNKVWLSDRNGICSTDIFVIRPKENKALPLLYAHIFRSRRFNEEVMNHIKGAQLPRIGWHSFAELRIPLPPLEIQKEIVAEIESYQKVIDGARTVVENYRPHIPIDPNWPIFKLGEVCDVRDGTHDSPKYIHEKGYPLVTSKNLKDGIIDFTDVNLISREDLDKINNRSLVDDGDIIMPMIGTIGKPVIVNKDREFAIKNVALIKFNKESRVLNRFLKNILSSDTIDAYFKNQSAGSTQKFISLAFIRNLSIPIPPIKIQEIIIENIEVEQAIVNSNCNLIKRFEDKIEKTINRVWGEE